jgi:hypothetical protein
LNSEFSENTPIFNRKIILDSVTLVGYGSFTLKNCDRQGRSGVTSVSPRRFFAAREAQMTQSAVNPATTDPRAALTARLWRAAELQAAEVEARIATGPRPAAEAERDARVLSVLAKTLRELSAVDEKSQQEDDDDAAPDDIDELREALGERLRKLSIERARTEEV